MNNRDVAAAFDEIADLLEFQNANPFRVRAYRNAARRISDLSEPLADDRRRSEARADRNRRHRQGPGREDRRAARHRLDRRCSRSCGPQIPGGVLAMVRIPGMGPKKAAALYKELGITSLDDASRAACEADQVQALKGFGKKTQDKILAGIDLAAQRRRADVLGPRRRNRAGAARPHAAAARASGRWKWPAATAAARKRSATSTCWSTPTMPTP